MITDIQEWLRSLPIRARPRAWGFIRENIKKIHHCPAVHAKAVISDSLAMMGSANLTNHGILGRTEMGILIDDAIMVAEIGSWFDSLWQQTAPPLVDETSAYVQWLDEEASKAPARRQKFSLSGASKLVRARLVKLQDGSTTPPTRDSQLDLGTVAQALVVQEHRHYDSIDQAIEATIDTLTPTGSFTLGDVVRNVKSGFEAASSREIYLLLIQHCANHVRSVFAESTRNRLILSNGKFTQSTREPLQCALSIFDTFLAYLIENLNFDSAQKLPSENIIEEDTGITGRDQVILVAELLECGLLEMEDVAGELSRYRLVNDFQWEGRYQLFTVAQQKWLARKIRRQEPPNASVPVYDISYEDYTFDSALIDGKEDRLEFSDGGLPGRELPVWLENRRTRFSESMENSGVNERARITAMQAEFEREQRSRVDSALAYILSKVLSGQILKVESIKKLAEMISSETEFGFRVGRLLLQRVLENRSLKWPPILVFSRVSKTNFYAVEVNPHLPWNKLDEYPATRAVCTDFLGMGDIHRDKY